MSDTGTGLVAEPRTVRRRSSDWACGEALEAAARYVQEVRGAPGAAARARAAASRDGVAAVRTVLRQLPDLPMAFGDEPTGRELRAWFRPDRRLPFNRAPVAVLELPGSQAEYLRGRPRQALRTNLTRAAAAGLHCAPVEDAGELLRVATVIADSRDVPADRLVRPGQLPGRDRLWSAAYTADGGPVALSHAIVDDDRAGLLLLITTLGHGSAPLVRYALHAHLTGRLVDRGVATLAVGGSMLLTSTGTRYFQQRTGFVPVHLRPEPGPARRRGRRTARGVS
ncbi:MULTISPECIES: hypothetical protein [unclassified Blastococcus]